MKHARLAVALFDILMNNLLWILNDNPSSSSFPFRPLPPSSKHTHVMHTYTHTHTHTYTHLVWNRGRLDVSLHPFTGGPHPTDVRITTRYSSDNWLQGVAGTVHEVGHALYEQVKHSPSISNFEFFLFTPSALNENNYTWNEWMSNNKLLYKRVVGRCFSSLLSNRDDVTETEDICPYPLNIVMI